MTDEAKDTTPEPTVKVKSLRHHTLNGVSHETGDEYDAPQSAVDNMVAQNMVRRVDPAAAPAPLPSSPVAPLSTESMFGKQG